MTPAGLEAFQGHTARQAESKPTDLPQDLAKRFPQHAGAWRNFGRFPPYYRRMTIGWVASARKQETRLKRLSQLIDFSDRNERIKFM